MKELKSQMKEYNSIHKELVVKADNIAYMICNLAGNLRGVDIDKGGREFNIFGHNVTFEFSKLSGWSQSEEGFLTANVSGERFYYRFNLDGEIIHLKEEDVEVGEEDNPEETTVEKLMVEKWVGSISDDDLYLKIVKEIVQEVI